MFRRKFRVITALLIFTFCTGRLFALEEYVSEIYKQIDDCFGSKNEKKLAALLSKNNNDRYYYLIENYTQKKIRRLIVNNDYNFAMEAILVVIENNLDNEEAVEMYSVISEAYEIQRKHEAELERQRQMELARIEMEKEKQRENVEKEYVAAKKTTGGAVYVSGKETKLTSSNWKIALGIADVLHLYDKPGDISSFHYGVSLDYRYEYTLDNKMVIGTDVFGGVQFMGFADEDKLVPLVVDADLDLKTSFPQLSKDLFFKVGFDVLLAGKSKTAIDTGYVVEKLFSPTIGIKMERIPLGQAKIDLGADWLAGHLFVKDINFAGGASMNIEIPFAEMEKVKLNFNIGVRDKFFFKTEGMENRASVILAIGVENVIR
ncbi:MAG: hypothetical protein J6X84_04685 [Treponema sp.]|nr:hypothetical protein [Treponema sp.]